VTQLPTQRGVWAGCVSAQKTQRKEEGGLKTRPVPKVSSPRGKTVRTQEAGHGPPRFPGGGKNLDRGGLGELGGAKKGKLNTREKENHERQICNTGVKKRSYTCE